jgi:hypothetical protein
MKTVSTTVPAPQESASISPDPGAATRRRCAHWWTNLRITIKSLRAVLRGASYPPPGVNRREPAQRRR